MYNNALCYLCKWKYKKVGVLPIRIVYSLTFRALALRQRGEGRANARNVRLYYPYWQYTNLFIFRFVSLHTLRLFMQVVYIGILVLRYKSEI